MGVICAHHFNPYTGKLILEAYGTESEYGWSEQDISEGIRHILNKHPAPPLQLSDFLK